MRESLELSRSVHDLHTLAHTLVVAAATTLALGDASAVARLCAADEVLCTRHGFRLEPLEQQLFADTTGGVREALGEGFEEAWAAGVEFDLSAAVDLALEAARA